VGDDAGIPCDFVFVQLVIPFIHIATLFSLLFFQTLLKAIQTFHIINVFFNNLRNILRQTYYNANLVLRFIVNADITRTRLSRLKMETNSIKKF